MQKLYHFTHLLDRDRNIDGNNFLSVKKNYNNCDLSFKKSFLTDHQYIILHFF